MPISFVERERSERERHYFFRFRLCRQGRGTDPRQIAGRVFVLEGKNIRQGDKDILAERM